MPSMKRRASDSSLNMSRDESEVVNGNGVQDDRADSVVTAPELVTIVGAGPAGLMLG